MPDDLESFVPHCSKCGYNLTGLSEFRCPECGTAFDLETKRKSAPSTERILTELLFLPLLFSLPSFCCGLIILLETTPGFFPLVVGVVLILLAYNGDRIRDKVSDHADPVRHRFFSFVARSNLITLVFLQLMPLFLFWGVIITLLIMYPPRLFPF